MIMVNINVLVFVKKIKFEFFWVLKGATQKF